MWTGKLSPAGRYSVTCTDRNDIQWRLNIKSYRVSFTFCLFARAVRFRPSDFGSPAIGLDPRGRTFAGFATKFAQGYGVLILFWHCLTLCI
jgi:hypothetical protein